MRTLAFLDLDDTLFQTARKCPPGEAVTAVSFSSAGEPVSYMTARQQRFFEWLGQDAELVPVTGRSLEAFRRVHLPFSHGAIVNHGATVLNPDGSRDEDWHARVQGQLEQTKPQLERLLAAARSHSEAHGLGVDACWDGEADLPLYLVAKHRGLDMDALDGVRQFWLEELAALEREVGGDLYLFANGNNVSVLPRAISKAAAVAYLLERERALGPLLTLGVGDSVSDLGFMQLCDFAVTPTGSQLMRGVSSDLGAHR